MGEQAEYMLNGDDCQECGQYIGPGDGYPRSCTGCKPKKKKVNIPTIGQNAVKGVENYLNKNKKSKDEQFTILNTYYYYLGNSDYDLKEVCEHIQKDFGKFVKWFKENYKK